MLFTSQSLPFPIQDDIAADESGLGYALRMAGENHLAFSDLAIEVGSDSRNYLPHRAAQQLAFWFGGNAVQLCSAIQESYKLDGKMVTKFMGHVFYRPYHVRQHAPQICPTCLWQYRKAFAWWDIALATICPEHGVQLIDVCPACARRISWRRPSLLFCQCGAMFSHETAVPDGATIEESWFTSQIRNLLCPQAACQNNVFEPRFSFLAELSLDCLLRLIWAFGILPAGGGRISPGEISRIPRTNDAVAVIGRAFARIRALLTDSTSTENQSGIQKTALRTMYDESQSWNEANLISTLLHLAAPNDRTWQARMFWENKRSHQFDLFGINRG